MSATSEDALTEGPPARYRRRRRPAWRLLPLLLLVLCVLAATVVGRVELARNPDADLAPAAQAAAPAPGRAAPAARTSLPARCTPAVRQDVRVDWSDPQQAARAEKRFTANIATEQPAYVAGRKGWLFWNDWQVQDFSQSVGRVRLQGPTLDSWARYLRRLQRQAERAGSSFYVVVAPAKWDVYPQLLPSWAKKIRGKNSLDFLMEAHPEIPFVDPRVALRNASRREATYEPLDSHWTPYGGWVAWRSIAACLRKAEPSLSTVRAPGITGVTATSSSNEFIDNGVVARAQPTTTVPVWLEDPAPLRLSSLDGGEVREPDPDNLLTMEQLPARTRSSDAPSPRSVLLMRDSTGTSVSGPMSASFRTTYQVTHDVIVQPGQPSPRSLLRQLSPDVTIFMMTERYLGYPAPS